MGALLAQNSRPDCLYAPAAAAARSPVVQPVVQPLGGPDCETIMYLPPDERAPRYEDGILALLAANDGRGLLTAEIERATGFPKLAVLKSLGTLYHQRRVHRVSHGRFRLYYSQRDEPAPYRDIDGGSGRMYNARRVSNEEGDFVRIEEREIDGNGFARDVGGVLVPLSKVNEVVNAVKAALSQAGAAAGGR